MSNNISIDELFREGLSHGKEQLNLGAWANMERMLDGKNPYSNDNDEPQKKKRILPFWIIMAGISAILSIGALFLLKSPNKAETTQSLPAQSNIANTQNEPEHTASPSPSQLSNDETEPQKLENINHPKSQNKKSQNRQFEKRNLNEPQAEKSSPSKSYQMDLPAEHLETDKKVALNTELPKNRKHQNNKNIQSKESLPNLAKGDKEEINEIEKNDKSQPVQQIFANEIVRKNRNGNVNSIQLDTILKIQNEIATPAEEKITEVALNENPKDEKYHARYIADLKNTEPEKPIALQNNQASDEQNNESVTLTKNRDNQSTPERNKRKETAQTVIGTFLTATFAKLAESGNDFLSLFKVLDPGLSAGVNAALFQTKHQYGGFHLGATNRTEISSTFSIISELKFFLRNNAGFTINDIETSIKDKVADTMSMQGYTIHSYVIDSLTKRYNFSNFMSLELPILVNAKFNHFSIYAGPNFIYNFRLKVNEVNKNYLISKQELVSNNLAFDYPETKTLQYSRDDFKARFGIGYSVGVSYNFNPKIYVDLRLNKSMWDNTRYSSEKEISKGVMNVPFIQLSLGYKFLNRTQ